jgi:hypothetical protein
MKGTWSMHPPETSVRPPNGGKAAGVSDGAPVYPHLVDALLAIEPCAYSPLATHVCATAAGWVYADRPGEVTSTMMGRLGLENVWCREIAMHNDVMLVASTAVLLQSACGRVGILCYRGTEPRNLMNWMTDFDVNPRWVRMGGSARGNGACVHLGFYRNLEATWNEVAAGLERALAGKPADGRRDVSLRPLEALYVTGHSLGAAMAALVGVYLATDPVLRQRFRERLRGVYTFGQPMVGNPELAALCQDDPLLRDGVFRHVYRNDVVPHLPAAPYGKFAHFGREFRVASRRATGAAWRPRSQYAAQAPDIVLSMVVVPTLAYWATQLASTRKLGQLGYSWYDHLPHFYIDASAPPDAAA